MPTPVNRKRAYRSPRRAAQAGETREAVLDAARSIFIEQGWLGATLAGIARSAGVSVETVYSVFGNKRALLQQLIARAVRGQFPDMPLIEQDGTRSVLAQSDPLAVIRAFAMDISGVLERVAPLVDVVRTAARAEPELSVLYAELHAGRRRNLELVAQALAKTGALRPELDADAAAAILWRQASPELFLLMRDVEGMTVAQCGETLGETLRLHLLP